LQNQVRAPVTFTPVFHFYNSFLSGRSLHARAHNGQPCQPHRPSTQESQAEAFAQCWRKDWQDSEPHLLPAKHVSAWIQNNLYLSLADAPFDREDPTLNPAAGACVTCPRRSGYNTSLFSDVTDGDQCLSAPCYQIKLTAHIDRELAVRPELIQIENCWRNAREQRPGAVQRGHFREIETVVENPDAEPAPSRAAAKPAIIIYGKRVGTTYAQTTTAPYMTHEQRKNKPPIQPHRWHPRPRPRHRKRLRNASATTNNSERSTSRSRSGGWVKIADYNLTSFNGISTLKFGSSRRKPARMCRSSSFPLQRRVWGQR
jgi:hypothetical protein